MTSRWLRKCCFNGRSAKIGAAGAIVPGQLYIDLVNNWPKSPLAPESLHAATLAAVDLGKIADAESLLGKRFDKEYAGSPLRLRQEILKGRVMMIRSEHDFAGAAKLFQNVIAGSEKDGTKLQARYYLGYALQNLSQHAQVLEVTEPLTAQMAVDKSLAEYAGVYVFRAESQRALARAAAATAKPGDPAPADVATYSAAAVISAKRYLESAPNGPLTSQALAVATMSEALAARKEPALQSLEALRKGFPNPPELNGRCSASAGSPSRATTTRWPSASMQSSRRDPNRRCMPRPSPTWAGHCIVRRNI